MPDAEAHPAPEPTPASPKYWAFISYSHRDARWGAWLHRALETYRVPQRLVGRDSRNGAVPKRLFPFFRDREELPTSADLGHNLQEALRQSRYLIVICSPHAAASRWVNEEVRSFKALGREDRILCLIVDGEPNASDKPGSGELECFPPAVRFRKGDSGERVEPIAADARPGRDGKPDAKLKLLAGLLGAGFDELKRRERQRLVLRRVQLAGLAALLLLLLGGVWQWQRQLRLTQARRDEIASLTESGRQELLAGNTQRSAVYLGEAYRLGGTDAPLRLMLGWVLPPLESELATLAGHSAAVNFAVYSPDGSRILTGADDGLGKIWNAQTHELIATLQGHKWFVRQGRFGPQGRKAYTVGSEDVVKIWKVENGELLATIDGEQMALSDDGALIVTTKDGKARLWDAQTGAPLRDMAGQTQHLAALAFRPDGAHVAGAGGVDADPPRPGSAPRGRIWEVATGRIVAFLEGHEGAINWVKYSPDGKLIATASTDRTAKLWDAGGGALLSSLGEHPDSVSYAEFSPDSTKFLTVSAQLVSMWDLTGKQTEVVSLVHEAWVNSAQFSPDGRLILTADNDHSAHLWDAQTGQRLLSLPGHAGRVQMVRFSPGGQFAVTAGFDHLAKIWDLSSSAVTATIVAERASSFAVSPSGEQVAIAGAKAEIWDLASGRQIQQIDAHHQWGVRDIAFSPDGVRIATASEDRTCKVWNAQSGAPICTFDGHQGRVMSVRFSPDGRQVVSAALDHSAKVWDAQSGELVRSLRSENGQAAFADFVSSGKQLVLAAGMSVSVWNTASGEKELEFPAQDVGPRHVAVGMDGKRLVATNGNEASVLELPSGRLSVSLVGHQAQINRVALNPAGSLIATAASDHTVRLWDAESGRPVLVLTDPADEFSGASFSPDGQSVITSTASGIVRVWNTRLEDRNPSIVSELVARRVLLKPVTGRLVPVVK